MLATNVPDFDIPTTGAIVDNWFYFIANSQLGNYGDGMVLDDEKLKEVVVMKVPLK